MQYCVRKCPNTVKVFYTANTKHFFKLSQLGTTQKYGNSVRLEMLKLRKRIMNGKMLETVETVEKQRR